MKTKVLLWILGGAVILILYNILCYSCVNMIVNNNTKIAIYDYFSTKYNKKDLHYEYKKAINNSDGTINVFIKYDEIYYKVILKQFGNNYQVILVNNDIPVYIKH